MNILEKQDYKNLDDRYTYHNYHDVIVVKNLEKFLAKPRNIVHYQYVVASKDDLNSNYLYLVNREESGECIVYIITNFILILHKKHDDVKYGTFQIIFEEYIYPIFPELIDFKYNGEWFSFKDCPENINKIIKSETNNSCTSLNKLLESTFDFGIHSFQILDYSYVNNCSLEFCIYSLIIKTKEGKYVLMDFFLESNQIRGLFDVLREYMTSLMNMSLIEI